MPKLASEEEEEEEEKKSKEEDREEVKDEEVKEVRWQARQSLRMSAEGKVTTTQERYIMILECQRMGQKATRHHGRSLGEGVFEGVELVCRGIFHGV
jgi:hypothetical protein